MVNPHVKTSTPCAAWSRHADDLAQGIAHRVTSWEETPETQALVLEGALTRLIPGRFLEGETPASPVDRALVVGCALGPQLRDHHVLCGNSALWVWTGVAPHMPLEILTPAHRSVVSGVYVRHMAIEADDIIRIGGVPVTMPERTATDALRLMPEDLALHAVALLISAGLAHPALIKTRLRHAHGLPGLPRARKLFDQIPPLIPLDQFLRPPEDTRLPSAVTRWAS